MITVHTGSSQPMTRLMIVQEAVSVITGLEEQLRGTLFCCMMRCMRLVIGVWGCTQAVDRGGMLSSSPATGWIARYLSFAECILQGACPSYYYCASTLHEIHIRLYQTYYYYYHIIYLFTFRDSCLKFIRWLLLYGMPVVCQTGKGFLPRGVVRECPFPSHINFGLRRISKFKKFLLRNQHVTCFPIPWSFLHIYNGFKGFQKSPDGFRFSVVTAWEKISAKLSCAFCVFFGWLVCQVSVFTNFSDALFLAEEAD